MIILYNVGENKKALLPWQTKELSFMEKISCFDRKTLFWGAPQVKGVQTPKRVHISESIPLGSTRGLFPLDPYLFLYSSSSGFAPLAS